MKTFERIDTLTNKELIRLHNLAAQGDKAAWDTLWMHGVRLVWKIADKMVRVGILLDTDKEDAIQEGVLAVGQSLPSWQPDRGKYSTFIWASARNAILTYALGEAQHGIAGDIDIRGFVQRRVDSFNQEEIEEIVCTGSDAMLASVEDSREVEASLEALTALERAVVFDYYFLENSDAQIGSRYGMSTSRAFNARHKAIHKMKQGVE